MQSVNLLITRPVITVAFVLGTIGCSTRPYEPGPAESAGRYVDQGLSKVKRATVEAYRSSRRWIYDTGQSIARGTDSLTDGWSGSSQDSRRRQEYRRQRVPTSRPDRSDYYEPDTRYRGREQSEYAYPSRSELERQAPRAQYDYDRKTVQPKTEKSRNEDIYMPGGAISSADDFNY